MSEPHPPRIRDLSFYRFPRGGRASLAHPPWSPAAHGHPAVAGRIHARSRFRSLEDPELFAVYAVHEPGAVQLGEDRLTSRHTLRVVREFRRVPLDASALGLALLRAHGGRAARAIAATAHWAERVVSLVEPAYLLVAHSLEEPRLIALLTGVHECEALLGSRASAFSLDSLLDEVGPLLIDGPEWYAYCAPRLAWTPQPISPFAV